MDVRASLKKIRMKFIRSVDVPIFEHLLPENLKTAVESVYDRIKAAKLYKCLERCDEDEIRSFFSMISGLYPMLFTNVIGREPTTAESGKFYHY